LDTDLTQFVLPDADKASAQGMMIYNTNAAVTGGKGVYVWSGTAWETTTVQPTGVSVSPGGPVSLVATGAGSTQQLSATVQPNPQVNQAVTWSGGSASIATVNSSGLVTAVSGAGGQTTVRATTVATPVRTADVTINVNPAQPGVITGAANIANGGTVTLSVPAVTGDTYTWTYPTANFTGSSTTNSITLTAKTVSANAAGSISVVANAPAHGGASPSRATTATVNVTPAQPGAIAGAANIANGGTVTLSVPAVAGATSYTWTFPAANFTGSSTTNSITLTGKTVSTNAAATFSVTATGVGGTSPARAGTTAINVVPAQPGTITPNPTTVTSGGNVTLTVPAVEGATGYSWTFPTDYFTQTSPQTTTSPTITLTTKSSGTALANSFSVVATSASGNSASRAGSTAITIDHSCDVEVKDGLCWGIAVIPEVSWNDAFAACSAIGWRLPTYSESSKCCRNDVCINGVWPGRSWCGDEVVNGVDLCSADRCYLSIRWNATKTVMSGHSYSSSPDRVFSGYRCVKSM
jgi:hypothetical protein